MFIWDKTIVRYIRVFVISECSLYPSDRYIRVFVISECSLYPSVRYNQVRYNRVSVYSKIFFIQTYINLVKNGLLDRDVQPISSKRIHFFQSLLTTFESIIIF